MDATQAISDSILESEEEENEEEIQNETKKPLAKLCILSNPHISEKELPLFLGDNVLGRDPNICTLQLLASSVSKQHATISISVYRRRGREREVEMEALVWDLGSMNGTRKGLLKLTPNVRYALSEGETLVLGNIPCRYVSSRVDSPSSLGDMGTPLCRHSEANARLSYSSDYASKKFVSCGTKAKRTPVTGGCLSFEQTPIQPQGSLVPESDSDSESERGDGKQKTIDSHTSSPSSSAFLSTPSKVVPESEDESPITPSSSSRQVSLSLEKTDVDLGRQHLEKDKSPAFVENGEEEGERAAKGGTYSEDRGENVKLEISKSPTEDDESLRSTLELSRGAIPEFNLDSDTDVEEGEEEVAPAGQRDQPPNTVLSHMDSDTDVDEDVSDKAPKTSLPPDETTKPSPVVSGVQLEGIAMDSDTDVDDGDANVTSKATLFQGVHTADSAPSVQSGDFHLDSDTDVDEEEWGGTGAKRENPKTDKTLDDKPAPTAPHNLHPDIDTCDKGVGDPSVAAAGASADGRGGLDILSESDTDLEADSPPAIPAAATELSVSSAAAGSGALEPDSDADTDVDEPVVSRARDEGKPADFRMESDTDVEDEEANLGEAEEGQIPRLQVPLLQKCSTPVQVSKGEVEQMETQAFISPTSDAVASCLRPAVMSSCSDSQEDEDYSVVETQSFILQTKSLNPSIDSVLESSAVTPEDQSTRGDSFQLGLSVSGQLEGKARTLATEDTQAYAPVDGGVNMEDTQAYEERSTAEDDPNLEATQPYGVDEEPARCSDTSKKEGCVDLAFEATQAYISEPYNEGSDEDEGENSARDESVASSALAMAETQPMCSFLEANNSVCSLEPVKTAAENETEEHQERHITEAQSVAETQPMFTSDNEESGAEELPPNSLKPAEEQKHPRTSSAFCLAETQPVCMSDSEESGDEEFSAESLRPAKIETEPNTSTAMSLAETQPLQVSADETEPMDLCDDAEILLPRKRKAKQLHVDEEKSQRHANSAETQPSNPSEDEDDSESMPILRKRRAKSLQLEDETQSLVGSQLSAAESQPSATCEEEQSSPNFFSPRKRKAKQLHIEDEQTQPLISSEASAIATSCEAEEREAKALHLVAAGVSPVEAQAQGRDGKSDGDESMAYPRKSKEKRLYLEEEETQPVTASESQRKTDETKVSPSTKETGEEEDTAQSSSFQNRQTKNENKPLSSTRGRRGKTKSEDDNNQEEGKVANRQARGRSTRKQGEDDEDTNKSQRKEQGDHGETERHDEREEMINEGKSNGKQRLKTTKSGSEIEDENGTSVETTKTDQDEKPDKKEEEQEHLARLKKATESKEKQPKESQENKDEEENPKGSVRVRRAARTAASPCEASSEDFPARRTRSRSNSVSSERSVSSINGNTQENKRRGRGRGAKRSGEASQTDAVRSSRRRTTVAAAELDAEAQALSASPKLSSTSSQNRGRPQGRGRKTSSQPDVVTPAIRGSEQKARRSSAEVLQQDGKGKADSRLAGTSRGQRRVSSSGSEALGLNDEGLQSNQEKASADLKSPLPKRNMRDRGPKAINTEHVEEAAAPTAASEGDEARHKRKARTSDRVQKPTEPGRKEEQKEEIPAGIQRRRTSRASSTQVKNNEESLPKKEEEEDGKKVAVGAAGKKARGRTTVVQKNKNQKLQETQTSGSSMNQAGNEEESETMTPPRKRQVSSNSSSVAKTPHPSTSPVAVSRPRAGSQAYKVLFTGVVDESGEQVLARLGGTMARGVSDMNCLVTDKVRRTVKFLCAVAKGVPVVTTHWLEKSGKAGSFLSPQAFVVKDPEQEKKFNFSLQESLRTASSQPLLQGYEIHVTKSVKPEPVHMKDIITCSGATFLPKMPTAHKPHIVVISCEEDLRLCGPAVSASLPVVTAEFILTGILQQRVDFQTHALSPSATNPQPAEGRGRGRKKT
ncbi:mediator of DNA damage checkpoint protein 1 isoform 2-T2 [Anableps anableps]